MILPSSARLKWLLAAPVLLLCIQGCEKDENTDLSPLNTIANPSSANQELYRLMQDKYYWYEHVPTIQPQNYNDPYTLMDRLKYDSIDQWSYVTTYQEYEQHFVQSKTVGSGIQLTYTSDNRFVVILVYKNSPASQKGIKRGWELLKIDGNTVTEDNYSKLTGDHQLGTTLEYTFKTKQDSTVTVTCTMEEFTKDPVYTSDIIQLANHTIGYLALSSFVEPTVNQLDSVFSTFSSRNIDELVLDLRYNTGGILSASNYLAGSINATQTQNQVYARYRYNDKYSYMDSALYFKETAFSLDVNRLFVITTQATASASELVINGLEPYMEVLQIGGSTYGKPVGMEGFGYDNRFIFFPVTLTFENANGKGDYFNGLDPDAAVNDDYYHQLGDTTENCLQEALYYIRNGNFSNTKAAPSPRNQKLLLNDIEKVFLVKKHIQPWQKNASY